LDFISEITDFVSPRLKIRFLLGEETLQLYHPDGRPFLTYAEIAQQVHKEKQRAEQAEKAREDAIPKLLQMGLSVEQIAEALGLLVEEVQATTAKNID
jgi:predicted transposase YdaD